MKVNGGYDWFKYTSTKSDGCSVSNYYDSKVYDIIKIIDIIRTPKCILVINANV